jgi:myo-inositol-1(or 4)-monophosphatase
MALNLESRFLAVAAVAREAGQRARRSLADRATLGVSMKGPQDWLTEADGAVERFVVAELGCAFPGDSFLGEEGGGHLGGSTWVIDPIDGTANFARGIAHFAVSIAYCRDGQVELGVIYDPMADELFAARRGAGAGRNGLPIRVTGCGEPQRALIDAGYSHRHDFAAYLAILDRLVGAGYAFRQAGSAALALAHVADGRIDGCCELHLFAWDVLAGLLLVREAGGWVCDFPFERWIGGGPMLASAPALAPSLRALTGIA